MLVRSMASRAAPAAVLLMLGVGGCSGEGESTNTMDPLEGTPGDTGGTTATSSAVPTTAPVSVDVAPAAAGFVSVTVQVASEGIDETLALDRAVVPPGELDPLNLDASCSALDGGEPVTLSIIDLRRLGAGSRLLSARLRTEEPATAPGEYDGTLEIADAEQLTTTFNVAVLVDEGGRSGSFQGNDEDGNVASGAFVCADQPTDTTTTTIPVDGGEEVPETTE